MPVFPSVEWFNAVREIINHDQAYRHLGTCDALVGIDVSDKVYKLTFEAFEVTDVEEISRDEEKYLDFTLTMSYERWKQMVENIKKNGRADLDFTLNTLDLDPSAEFARSNDYYNRDKFYRFNQSFQNFFDASARIDTQFADAAVAG
jgi:hypothetical protein